MKKWVNGKIVEMEAEEITAMQTEARKEELIEKSRPMTESEVSLMIIEHQINALSVDDNTALRMMNFFPEWKEGNSYAVGHKVRHNDKLWRVVQGHTSQSGWEPENAASLWEQVNETHDGTAEDPIPYSGNMRLESGKHYIQEYMIFKCFRDTGNPVYNALSELVGLYVEEI